MTQIYCGVEECEFNDGEMCSRDIVRVDSTCSPANRTECCNCMSFRNEAQIEGERNFDHDHEHDHGPGERPHVDRRREENL